MQKRILVIDPTDKHRRALVTRLQKAGYDIVEASNAAAGESLARGQILDAAIVELVLPDLNGIAFLRILRDCVPALPIYVISAHATVDTAVEAMKEGARDYFPKPLDYDHVVRTLNRVLRSDLHEEEMNRRKRRFGLANIIGESEVLRRIKEIVRRVAESETTTVLLLGETGTGKDMFARAIHYESARVEKPFMNITCTALPETLLESELFGYEEGAFTNARGTKKGLFELGHNGTVFMDEIGDMPLALQGKLLRVLEERAFKRIGGVVDIVVDVRIVAATNRNLSQLIDEGKFREDLYYRLSTVPIELPSLRERLDDVPVLAEHFLEQYNRKFKREVADLQQTVIEKLMQYSWPGNVRELRNVIERAVLLSHTDEIAPEDVVLGRHDGRTKRPAFELPAAGCSLDDVEQSLVEQALTRTNGNQTKAAVLLGISRDQLRYKAEKFGLLGL
jgi:DNA-binding NtrC family response regulator